MPILSAMVIMETGGEYAHILNIYSSVITVVNLIQCMEKNNSNFEKRDFLVKVVNCSINP